MRKSTITKYKVVEPTMSWEEVDELVEYIFVLRGRIGELTSAQLFSTDDVVP
jgi:hypothetical protein